MKLHIYIFRQLLVGFSFAVGGVLFVALPGIAVATVHKLPNADAVVLLRYIPLVLQTLAAYVLPMCFLLALVSTYGRLAADREWTAIQMAGVRPAKMLLPAMALAAPLVGFTYWMVSTQLPLLKTRQRQLLVDASSSSIANLAPGRTSLQIGGFLLEALWQDPDTGLLHEVYIRKPETRDATREDLHAGTADLNIADGVLLATFTDLYVVRPEAATSATYHEWVQLEFSLADYVKKDSRSMLRPRYVASSTISARLAAGEAPKEYRKLYLFELHYRWVLATSFVLFIGLGVPTGLMLRRGTQLSALAVSSGYALFYYVLVMRVSKDLAELPKLPPAVAAWAPASVFGVFGLYLLRRALRR